MPRRAELLRTLLTIWRWGRQNQIKAGVPLASFDTYCRWIRDPLLALGCKAPVVRIDEMKAADPAREHLAEVFTKWWELHGSDAVTAAGLHAEVCVLIDPNYGSNARKRVIGPLASSRGARIAGFVLQSNARSKGKWSPTKYWLVRTEEGHQQAQTETADAHGGETREPDDPADGWSFNSEPQTAFDFDECGAPRPPRPDSGDDGLSRSEIRELAKLPYEVLGAAPAGHRCTLCGNGGGHGSGIVGASTSGIPTAPTVSSRPGRPAGKGAGTTARPRRRVRHAAPNTPAPYQW
jgi:hypothetical protein